MKNEYIKRVIEECRAKNKNEPEFLQTVEVDEKLRTVMTSIHDSSAEAAEKYGLGYNLVAGANIAGFLKVADAMMAQGIC